MELHELDGRCLGEVELPWPNIARGDVVEVNGRLVVIRDLVPLFPGSRLLLVVAAPMEAVHSHAR